MHVTKYDRSALMTLHLTTIAPNPVIRGKIWDTLYRNTEWLAQSVQSLAGKARVLILTSEIESWEKACLESGVGLTIYPRERIENGFYPSRDGDGVKIVSVTETDDEVFWIDL